MRMFLAGIGELLLGGDLGLGKAGDVIWHFTLIFDEGVGFGFDIYFDGDHGEVLGAFFTLLDIILDDLTWRGSKCIFWGRERGQVEISFLDGWMDRTKILVGGRRTWWSIFLAIFWSINCYLCILKPLL